MLYISLQLAQVVSLIVPIIDFEQPLNMTKNIQPPNPYCNFYLAITQWQGMNRTQLFSTGMWWGTNMAGYEQNSIIFYLKNQLFSVWRATNSVIYIPTDFELYIYRYQ